MLFFLVGCTAQFSPPEATPTNVQPTRTILVLPTIRPTASQTRLTPTKTMSITVSPTVTTTLCAEAGVISIVEIPSLNLKENLRMRVYLPPCYQEDNAEGYPLLIMLHGQNGQDDQWIKLGLTEEADRMIMRDDIPAMVVVFPWERLYLQDWHESKYGAAILEDLLPFILNEYNINSSSQLHAIGGLSRGASWAVQIGMSNPSIFGVIGGHSFPSFGGEIRKLSGWIEQFDPQSPPALYFDIGKYDRYKRYCDPFMEALTQQEVDHDYIINDGAHDSAYWQGHIVDYLVWYGGNLDRKGLMP